MLVSLTNLYTIDVMDGFPKLQEHSPQCLQSKQSRPSTEKFVD